MRKAFGSVGKYMARLLLLAQLCICFSFLLGGCGVGQRSSEKSFFMMDTIISVRLYCDEETAAPLFEECRKILEEVENLLSCTIEDSLVSRFNRDGEVRLSEDMLALWREIRDISEATAGTFDPTVEPLVTLWRSSGEAGRLPTAEEMAEALESVGMEHVRTEGNLLVRDASCATRLDLGAVGKGYAIRKVLAFLETTDVPGGILSFGGNIATFGEKPDGSAFRVAVRDPAETNGTLGILETESGKVVSVSGDYERYVEIDGIRYHHIVDPATGYPAEGGLHSVAVICEDPVLADALSTALFVMGRERAMEFYASGIYTFEAILTDDDTVWLTPGLEGAFFLTGAYNLVKSGTTEREGR